MSTQSVMLKFPPKLYERLRLIAEKRNHSIEAVALELIVSSLETEADPAALLEAMDGYSDDELWEVVYQRLTDDQHQRYSDLVERANRRTITPAERSELDRLLKLIDRQMLLRSKALALLVERGHDVQSRFRDGEWARA